MIPPRNIKRFLRKTFEQPFYAIKVGYKRLKAYLYYDLFNGKTPLPESITIFLTHRCNLTCKMCGQWGETGVTRSLSKKEIIEELNINELKNFIDRVSYFRPNITLFGGEPFLYGKIIELIGYIKSKKMHCLVITNGSLLKNFAQDIVKLKLDELNLSLDGDEQTHDEIRGTKGLFKRIVENVNAINSYKKEYNSKKPLINLQCTINSSNYLKLKDLLDVANLIGANSLTCHHLIFLNDEIYKKHENLFNEILPDVSSSDWKGFIFETEIDPYLLVKEIDKIKRCKTNFFVNFYPNFSNKEIINYYINPQYLPEGYKPRCLSPWITGYIFPDGSVRPCLNFSYSYGNIKENDFREIWNSKKAIEYCNILKNNKIFPCCIRCTELFRY